MVRSDRWRPRKRAGPWLGSAVILGCSGVLGIEELPLPPSSACLSCAEASCAAQLSACRADVACASVEACFEACAQGDAVCHEKCKRDAAPSTNAIVAVEICRAATCASECQIGCGSVAWATSLEAIDECRTCMSAQCCDAASACGTDGACEGITWCRDACVTLDCFQTCRIDNIAGDALAEAARVCAGNQCQAECGVGSNWSCVPAVWPQDSSKTLEFTFGLYEYGPAQRPSPGFTVRACERTNVPCDDPIGQGVTNEAGIVVFDLEAKNLGGFFKGFDQYFEVEVSGTGYFPTLYQLSPPATSPSNARVTAMIAADHLIALARSVQINLEPERGHVLFQVVDCSGTNAPDIELFVEGADDAVKPIYFEGFSPVAAAEATTTTGIGGLLNVKPGTVTVAGRLRQTGEVVGKVVGLLVRAGTLTSSDFCPSPL